MFVLIIVTIIVYVFITMNREVKSNSAGPRKYQLARSTTTEIDTIININTKTSTYYLPPLKREQLLKEKAILEKMKIQMRTNNDNHLRALTYNQYLREIILLNKLKKELAIKRLPLEPLTSKQLMREKFQLNKLRKQLKN